MLIFQVQPETENRVPISTQLSNYLRWTAWNKNCCLHWTFEVHQQPTGRKWKNEADGNSLKRTFFSLLNFFAVTFPSSWDFLKKQKKKKNGPRSENGAKTPLPVEWRLWSIGDKRPIAPICAELIKLQAAIVGNYVKKKYPKEKEWG